MKFGSVGPKGILDSASPGIYVKIWKTLVLELHRFNGYTIVFKHLLSNTASNVSDIVYWHA